jgi:gluconokinase
VRSPIWLQIQADMFGRRLARTDWFEGSALGAAVLGHYALGILPHIDAAANLIVPTRTIEPNEKNYGFYREVITLYQQAYSSLTPLFSALRKLRRAEQAE